MVNSSSPHFFFPDEFASPKKKESREYGIQYAKSAYYSNNRYGFRLYNETSEFNALIELAQGKQSKNNIYQSLGFFNDNNAAGGFGANSQGLQDQNGANAYIDVQVLNLVTKYVNRAVAKLQRNKYDINFSAVDPLSVDQAKQKASQIKTFYELKDWMTNMAVDPNKFFPDLNLQGMPDHPDELMFNMQANLKTQKIVDAEKTMKLINHTINDMDQQLRMCDWYSVVLGRAHMHCYLDENNMPRAKYINPKFWGGSYVENEDFTKQEYAFFIEFITKNQFKTEAQGDLTKAEMEEVVGQFAFPNTAASFGSLPQYYDNYDGLEYIPVMRFYFLSNDNVAYKIWDHKETGNRQMDQTHYNYFPTEQSKNDYKVVQNSYTSVYGGTWVLDSDTCYNYGRKQMPKTMLVNSRLPIVTFAPNMKEGRIVSMVAQMVEPAYMINVAWNRMKDILAKGRMGVLELDLTAIDNIALGKGGQAWTPREAIDFFMQSNIWVKRSQTNQYGQNIGQAIKESNAGLTIADYLSTITTCIKLMDDLSGASVVESAQLPDRLTTGAMEASVSSSGEALEYLANGHMQIYKQSSHILMLLAQQAKQNKAKIQGLIPALGTGTTEYFEVPDELAYSEYGLQMTPSPGDADWAEFYAELVEALKEGRINASDSAFIRQVKDMTLARYVLSIREQSNERKAAAMNQQNQQFQAQSAQAASEARVQEAMQIQQQKHQDDLELASLQAKVQSFLIEKTQALKNEADGVSNMVKQNIAKQDGLDTILKESIRAKSNDLKSNTQHASKITDAMIKSQTALATAEISAKSKPAKEPKKPVKK